MKYFEMPVKPEWVREAEKKAKKMGILKNSILKGEGSVAGFIGEFAFVHFIKTKYPEHSISINNTYDSDIIYEGWKLECKTKQTNGKSQHKWEASVAKSNPNQKCHVYVFVRVSYDRKKAWICGWMSKKEYFDKAWLRHKGHYDPSNGNGCLDSCYNLHCSELNQFKIKEEK